MWQAKNKFIWLTCFAVFRVYEYCSHAYILKIIVQSLFLVYSQLNYIAFYNKSNFTLQLLINIFGKIKTKTKYFGISYHNHVFFRYYIFFHDCNDFIKLLEAFLVILLCWYRRYSISLTSLFNLYELFSAF